MTDMLREKLFIFLTLTMLMQTYCIDALTFTTELIKDSQHSNYLEFIGENPNISNAYDKKVADLNNDGFDDIISLGGRLQCIVCIVQPPTPNQPIEIMLYDNGDFKAHPNQFSTDGAHLDIVDIDLDGDLDLLLNNGSIAYNDGHANFTETAFTTDKVQDGEFLSVDWDLDGDIDIISSQKIYLNDGNLIFYPSLLNIPNHSKNFIITDLNDNGLKDIIINHNGQLQSWINNGSSQLQLLSSVPIEEFAEFKFTSFDFNNDAIQDFFMVKNDPSASISLIINDGHGHLAIRAFELPEMIQDIPHDHISVTSIHTIDADNDGDLDVWINARINNLSPACYHQPNLLMIYENDGQGHIQFRKALHSSGYDTYHRSHFRSNMPTIIDINNDDLPDVITTGERSLAWRQVTDKSYVFELTEASTMQFNQRIQAKDYNQDGKADILSIGQVSQDCTSIDAIDKVQSAMHEINATGHLWLGEGNGQFIPFQMPSTDMLDTDYQYLSMVDLDNNGIFHQIVTLPDHQNHSATSYYIDPYMPEFIGHVTLPIATNKSFTADMGFAQGDEIIMQDTSLSGNIFIVEKSAKASSLLHDQFSLVYGFLAESNFVMTDFSVQDIDNDGHNDIIILNKSSTSSHIKTWLNDGNNAFNPSSSFADKANEMTIGDFNGDGMIDIFTIGEEKKFWINDGRGSFKNTTYDQSLWLEPFPVDSQNLVPIMPEKAMAQDINNDGLSDLFLYANDSLDVYINTSKQGLSFYKNYSTFVPGNRSNNPLNHSNVDFADFNNDGLMDFVSGSDHFIKINTQNALTLKTGLYYDPSHNGHGYVIEAIGRDNLYHAIFFTYDQEGKPQWYSMLNQLEAQENYWKLDRINGENIIHYIYDYENKTAIIDHSAEHSGWMTFFNEKDQSSIDHTFFQIGEQQDMWPLQPIISSSLNIEDFSGLWWAGKQDAGWGLSLLMVPKQKTTELIAILYFYDENGQPRWLMGQTNDFIKDMDIAIEMKQINGYAREQKPTELTEISAGSITINLHKPSNDLDQAGILSMDVHYPDDQFNNNWLRKNIPIALFSQKRQP